MLDLRQALQNRQPLVVGSIGQGDGLPSAEARLPVDCDLLELRLDGLGGGEEIRSFATAAQSDGMPLLLTARCPHEGGLGSLTTTDRSALLETFLPWGAAIDLELRSLEQMAGIWKRAATEGLLRVASYHDFDGCPPLPLLIDRAKAMKEAGADLAKFAFRIDRPADLQVLAEFLQEGPDLPLAAMGMGPLAPSSRLLAAQLGSVFNYGYLGTVPTAPGQWPARLLKEAIAASGRVMPSRDSTNRGAES